MAKKINNIVGNADSRSHCKNANVPNFKFFVLPFTDDGEI